MNKYQITHYWSDENTFPEHIEQYIIKAKNEDNAIKQIKKTQYKSIRKAIYDLGCYPTVIGIDMVYDDNGNEYTQDQYTKIFKKEISEDQYSRFYGWDIIQIEN